MRARRYIAFILRFAATGAVVALVLLLLAAVLPFFPLWLQHIALVACPPSLMLMATEGCGGWLSWCSIQVMLLVVLGNAILYGILGSIVALLVALAGRVRARGAA